MTINSNPETDTDLGFIRSLLPAGSPAYAVVRHVSPSGTLRRMDLFAIRNNDLILLNGLIRDALGWKLDGYGHVEVKGAGMNMVEKVVKDLSRALYGDAYSLRPWMI